MTTIATLTAQLEDVSARVDALIVERDALQSRQQELLVTIRNLSSSVPYAEEAGNAATLIAEVGTLRAQLAETDRRISVENDALRASLHESERQLAEVTRERDAMRAQQVIDNDEYESTNHDLGEARRALTALRATIATAREAHGDPISAAVFAIVRNEAADAERERIAAWLEAMLAKPMASESEAVIAAIRANAHKESK